MSIAHLFHDRIFAKTATFDPSELKCTEKITLPFSPLAEPGLRTDSDLDKLARPASLPIRVWHWQAAMIRLFVSFRS